MEETCLREKEKGRRPKPGFSFPDPRSRWFEERITVIDELENLLARLSERDAEILLAMVETVFRGEKLNVPKIARKVGMSVRTVERRIRVIRRMSRRYLE